MLNSPLIRPAISWGVALGGGVTLGSHKLWKASVCSTCVASVQPNLVEAKSGHERMTRQEVKKTEVMVALLY